MRSKYKSLIAFLLIAVMVFTMLPTSVANAGGKKGKKSSQLVTGAVVGTEGVVEMEPTEDKGTATTKSNGKFEAVTVPSGSEEEILVGDEATDANNGNKYLQSLFAAPLVNDGETGDPAPRFEKHLYPNGDGTYTLSLSVTGSKSTETKINKANVVLVLDTSSSMNGNADTNQNRVYYKTFSTPGNPADEGNVTTTYYRKSGDNYYQLYYWDGNWYENDNHTTRYTGTDFYARSRLLAEKHALTDDNGIIDNLLSKNVSGDPERSDIIEVALVDFNGSATQQMNFSTDKTALKNKINGLTTASGTNWEESLKRAKDYIASIPAAEAEKEKTYVIFLTDGEPTAYDQNPGPYTGNGDRERMWGYAKDDARDIVTGGAEFYALYTWGNATYKNYLSGLVEYAYGNDDADYTTSPEDMSEDNKKYFTDASSTEALIQALKKITQEITDSVAYTDVGVEDGVTAMTHTNIKASVGGGVTDGVKYYRSGGDYGTADPENGQYGTEWGDAPDASFSGGNVDWNLGEQFELENGVTYTITFVVWPDQDSLNLVADLNNDLVDYDSLTDAQKEQIKKDGNSYKLKTNTDYPEVTYRTIKTETVDGTSTTVVSGKQFAKIDNPDPVPLAGAKLDAEKLWEDSLDPTQREEMSEVKLYLKIDNDYYADRNGNRIVAQLTEASDWTHSNYIAIAPGLMVTEDSPAYDPTAPHYTFNGTTYCMLELGHEYIFEEDQSNIHFVLTAYYHHPMIMGANTDGSLIVKDVIFKKENGQITGIEDIKDLADSISATNTLKGGINIAKKVVDSADNEIEDTNTFTIKVNVTDADGNALPQKTANGTPYTIDYRIYYGPNNPAYATSGDLHRSDHIYKTGTSFEETIYVGDTIRVVNVELDALFNVEEELPAGYKSNSYEYKIGYGQETPVTYEEKQAAQGAEEEEYIVDKNGTKWYRVKGNCACYATVINKCPAPFYVYHSSDNTVEKIQMNDSRVVNGKFNIVNETKSGHIYGGYYKGYSKAGLTDAQIIAAQYAKKSGTTTYTYADDRTGGMWMTDSQGQPYVGDYDLATEKSSWDMNDTAKGAYTDKAGTVMEPKENGVYYLKEVPEVFLTPAAYTVYDLNDVTQVDGKDFYQVVKLYMLSLTDDGNYKETGFDTFAKGSAEGTAYPAAFAWGNQIDVKQNGATIDTLYASSVVDGKTGMISAADVTTNPNYIVTDNYYRQTPYHITPDNVKVTSIKRMVVYVRNTRFNTDWIKPGMTKIFTGTKSTYAVAPTTE